MTGGNPQAPKVPCVARTVFPEAVIEELRRAAHKGQLVLFVGAGVSRLVGGPSWDDLAEWALRELSTAQVIIDEGCLASLSTMKAREKLSSVTDIANDQGYPLNWDAILDTSEMREHPNRVIHDHLIALGTHILTTNYDRCFDHATAMRSVGASLAARPATGVPSHPHIPTCEIVKDVMEAVGRLGPDLVPLVLPGSSDVRRVIHLHGHLDDRNSMVVSIHQYRERYHNTAFVQRLQDILCYRTVLFIGYGLEEDEILDRVYLARCSTERRHFKLHPVGDSEAGHYWGIEQHNLRQNNVQLIRYGIGDGRHEELLHVVKHLLEAIRG